MPIADELRHDRLVHRELRLHGVLRELRRGADAATQSSGHVPTPLRHAITDFEHQLRAVRRALVAR